MDYLVAAYFVGMFLLLGRAIYLNRKWARYLAAHYPEELAEYYPFFIGVTVWYGKRDDDPEYSCLQKKARRALLALGLYLIITLILGLFLVLLACLCA